MNNFKLFKRQTVNELSTFYSFLIGFIIAIIIGSIILLIQDKNPLDTFSLMLRLSVGSVNSLSSSLNKAIPLILAGLGISIINSVKLWNIGAEGQIFLGAIAVNFIYINTQFNNPSFHILVLLLAGFVGGSVCILIPAITKVVFGVNEIITTLLTNYIVFGVTIFLINGPWKDPKSLNFPAAAYVGEEVFLPTVIGKLSFGFLIFFIKMKKMKYESPNALFGNGPCPTHPIVKDRLRSINTFFCVDGGADKLITMGYNPDVILGDLDSIKKREKAYNCAIVYLEDQSKNDLEKSVCWCANQGIKELELFGFSYGRDDHHLANLLIMKDFSDKIRMKMYTEKSLIFCINEHSTFLSKANQTVSIFTLTKSTTI